MDRLKSRSEEHTSELQSPCNLVCRLLLEKKVRDMLVRPAEVARHRSVTLCGATPCLRPLPIASSAKGRPRPMLRSEPPGFFFFNDTATTEIYTLFPTRRSSDLGSPRAPISNRCTSSQMARIGSMPSCRSDRKSTRLNSSHLVISYAVFCLKK